VAPRLIVFVDCCTVLAACGVRHSSTAPDGDAGGAVIANVAVSMATQPSCPDAGAP